jgi:hypothetical protein
MSYIGNSPSQIAFLTDTFSGNGSTTAFTMSVAPANTASVLVAVSGVLQDPSTYSVSGLTLTFSAAPPSGTGNISARYLGIPASGVTTTAYRTITEFTATAGQTTFTPPSYTVGFIQVFRNGVLLGSADYTATNGTTVVLAGSGATSGDLITTVSFYVSSVLNAIPATAGSVGTTYLAAGSVTQTILGTNVAGNGPAFSAYGTAGQSLTTATFTKIAFNTKIFDTNSNYDTTNYRFTPTVAGYYQINSNIFTSASAAGLAFIVVYKNGSTYCNGNIVPNTNGGYITANCLVQCNGSTDYIEIYAYQNSGVSLTFGSSTSAFQFSGCLVRGA